MDLNVLKNKKSVPSLAFVLWVDILSVLATGMGEYTTTYPKSHLT